MVDLLTDGSGDFSGGQNGSIIPDKIAPNEYAAGVNTSVARASVQPRWGFERKTLQFELETLSDPFRKPRTYQSIFEAGKFQAQLPFYYLTREYVITVISGRIFATSIDDFNTVMVPITDGSVLNPRRSRINWTVAGSYIVLYDSPNYPVILDGLTARRADPADLEIPVSTQGAFNQNRLFVVNGGSEFTGGDPVGSLAAPDAPITFAEVLTPGSAYYGQIFDLPTNAAKLPITYTGFLQVSDISTGMGPLICATRDAIYTFNTQNPRSAWAAGQFGSVLCYNAGVAGPRSFVNVNSDAFFLGTDGYVRSLSMSSEEQKRWARVPVSREVERWFKFWDRSLIGLGFVGYFKNKIFFSVNPYRVPVIDFDTNYPIADYTHGGMVIMELDSISSFGTPSKPVWTGLWTGVNPMDMCVVGDRAFIMSKDGAVNRLYEINPEITYDTAEDIVRPVRSKVYTREYDFKDPFLNKGLHSVDLNLDALQGNFNVKVDYKPSHSPCFIPLGERTHKAPWQTCSMPEDCFIGGFAPHVIRDFSIGDPPDDQAGSPVTQDLYRIFKKVQLLLTFTGIYWEMHEMRIKATPELEPDTHTMCDEYPETAVCACSCNNDWVVDDFGGCTVSQT